MATPSYKGANQPSPIGDGWLGSWLGGTPAYKQRSMTGVAQTATDASMADQGGACGPGPIAIVIPREVIEQQ